MVRLYPNFNVGIQSPGTEAQFQGWPYPFNLNSPFNMKLKYEENHFMVHIRFFSISLVSVCVCVCYS